MFLRSILLTGPVSTAFYETLITDVIRGRLTEGIVNKAHLNITAKQRGESSPEMKKRLIQKWLHALHDFEPSPEDDINKYIGHTDTLDVAEQDKVLYILESKVYQDWLREPRSSLLHIQAETAPTDIINFMSVSTASLALTLGRCTNFAVLSFFCGLRKSASLLEDNSGVLGMLKSLNGQLLKFVLERRPEVGLPFAESDKCWRNSRTSLKYAWTLFKSILLLLPDSSVVFILLDSASRASGDKAQVDELVQKIMDTAGNSERGANIVAKVLVTDSSPSSRIRAMAKRWHNFYVPDDVEGWICGINHRAIEGRTVASLRNLQPGNGTTDSSDDHWDLSSDDGTW